jgi:site-specific DNA recombinase
MNVGIWIRVSTDIQAQSDSPEIHEKSAQLFCEFHNFTPTKIYNLAGVSGKSVLWHPEAQRMLADVAAGEIKGLVFSSLSRLARSLRELVEIEGIFRKFGATLHAVNGELDTGTIQGRMFFGLSGVLAEWERETIAARVTASVLTRARSGKKVSGQQPFGLIWADKDNLVIDHDKAAIVRRAFELFVIHRKIKTVCAVLNDAGYRAAASEWSPKTMKRLLVNEVYVGRYFRNYSRSKGDKKSWEYKPTNEWIEQPVEPIISQELWDTVQNILTSRPQVYSNGVPKEGKYLFSGILVCPCGKKLYVTPYKGMTVPRYVCRSCRNKISEDILVANFLPVLHSVIIDPELLRSESNNTELLAQRNAELLTLKSEKSKIEKQINKLFELFTDGLLKKEQFSERHVPLQDRRPQLDTEIARLEADMVCLRQEDVGRQHIATQAQTLSAEWLELGEEERRRIVRVLLDRVDIGLLEGDRQSVEFVFAFDLQGVFPELPTDSSVIEKGGHNVRDSWRQRA